MRTTTANRSTARRTAKDLAQIQELHRSIKAGLGMRSMSIRKNWMEFVHRRRLTKFREALGMQGDLFGADSRRLIALG